MVDEPNETFEEEKESVSEESSTPGISQNGENRQSKWKSPKRRLILGALMAVAAAFTTIIPAMEDYLGSSCAGYFSDYYRVLAPFTLVAALIGFVIGAALPELIPVHEKGSLRVGCGIVAIAIGGLVCMLASMLLIGLAKEGLC